MKREKNERLLLIFLILLTILILYAAFYIAAFVIPQKAMQTFGRPDSELDFAQRVLYAIRLTIQKDDLLQPSSTSTSEMVFTITYGETATETAANLAGWGLIRSSQAFTDLLVYLGNDSKIRAGIYTLSPSMTALEIANHVVDPNPEDVAFSFLEGWRAEEIASLLPQSGLSVTYDEFMLEVQNPSGDFSILENTGAESLEGFLFPDEYQVLRSAGYEDLIAVLLNNFSSQIPSGYEEFLQQKGLSLYEGLILASIVQKEMVLEEEGPLIASVFLNRLDADMPLQSDPTVQYALGFDFDSSTWWKNPLSESDLQVDSPYNTYLNNGLPPTPICNPGVTALLAVVNAEDTSYLYFRAACDGSGGHVFSETYEEHLAGACP